MAGIHSATRPTWSAGRKILSKKINSFERPGISLRSLPRPGTPFLAGDSRGSDESIAGPTWFHGQQIFVVDSPDESGQTLAFRNNGGQSEQDFNVPLAAGPVV